MSTGLKGKAAAYQGIRDTIRGLRKIASGDAIRQATEEYRVYLDGRLKGELKRHVATGKALNTSNAAKATSALLVRMPGYLGHPGKSDPSKKGKKSRLWKFSWRRGTPKTALVRGAEILRQAVLRQLPGGSNGR